MGLHMKRFAGTLAVLLVLGTSRQAAAQVFIGPAPAPGYGYGGAKFVYRNGNVVVTGYLGSYGPAYYPPYPPPYQQTTVVVPPPRVNITNNYYGGSGPVLGPGYRDDTSGVDLDLVTPKKQQPPEQPDEPPFKRLPGVDVSKSKGAVRPGDPGAEPKQPPKEPLPPPEFPRPPEPLPEPRDESTRLIELGLLAFQNGDYGHAAQRFRQAAALDPLQARPLFLLAQAEFAMGKFRDAVETIQAGVKLDRQWPRYVFQPRIDLYKGRDAEYAAHLKRLTDAAAANPQSGTLLFLVGHQLWFDGQRKDGLAVMQRARPLVRDPSTIDAFLAAGGPGMVAGL
jgi:tetratricopeptide (TPR) repeat protein